jgi:hypothetical protein
MVIWNSENENFFMTNFPNKLMVFGRSKLVRHASSNHIAISGKTVWVIKLQVFFGYEFINN